MATLRKNVGERLRSCFGAVLYRRYLLAVLCVPVVLTAAHSVGQQVYPEQAGANDAGFQMIFDGKSLAGWDGDPTYWRAEAGALVGEVTPATILKQNTFIIWRRGVTRDFELKLDYRISAGGNSGVNYRSAEIPNSRFALRGYQADIDAANKYTGQNYEEKGRTFLALRGDVGRIDADGKARIVGVVGSNASLATLLKIDDWNAMHLIVRGNVMAHLINGQVMSVVVDDDVKHRAFTGLLGMQVHVGPPMKVEYRDIRLKTLPSALAPELAGDHP